MQITNEAAFRPGAGVHGERLIKPMVMSREESSRRFRNSAVERTRRWGLLRNVAVALGNWGSSEAVPLLATALHDEERPIRGHAAWAPGGIGGDVAMAALRRREGVEDDAWVREEIGWCALHTKPRERSPRRRTARALRCACQPCCGAVLRAVAIASTSRFQLATSSPRRCRPAVVSR